MYTTLLVAHTILVLFLIFMVLMQRTDSDGLSGISGGGGNQFMTGRGTANFMTRTTAILAAAFMITSVSLAAMAGRMNTGSIIDSIAVDSAKTTEKTTGSTTEKPSEEPAESTPAAPVVPKPE